MKNKKTAIVISSVCAAVILVSVLIAVFTGINGHDAASDTVSIQPEETNESSGGDRMSVPPAVRRPERTGETDGMDDMTASVTEGALEPEDPQEDVPAVTGKAEKEDLPAATAAAVQISDPEPQGSVVIGGGEPAQDAYDCGTPGHHCDGPETHAYICNLELEGCVRCGSHSCPSFYALDEWGHTCYDPSECPEYSDRSDPLYYCQKCGKKTGDGSGATCATFNVDTKCPLCGESVKAWECHTCG